VGLPAHLMGVERKGEKLPFGPLFIPFAHVGTCQNRGMAKGDNRTKEVVTYGAAKVVVWPRGDGRWALSWSQGGRGKSSTFKMKDDAMRRARKIVRELVAGVGSREVSMEDVELLAMLRRVAGDRSPVAMLGELEDALRSIKGVPLSRLVSHWLASGMGDVERVTVRQARNRFLDQHEQKSVWTKAGLRKELDSLWKAHPDLAVCDVDAALLGAWMARPKEDGSAISARFFNNRHASWSNFFNRCREWGYWPKGEKHPAESVLKRKEPRGSVPIWTPGQAHAILALLQAEMIRQVPYVVIGCWLGLRPTEITRVCWHHFDWTRGYLHCDLTIARKMQEERFVPLNPKARALLEGWLRDRGLWEKALAGELRSKCCLIHDREEISKLVRKRGLIEDWPQDVMRHSYISYRIAQGDSKHEVAEAAGNSEGIIRKRYRRPLMREDGDAWFALTPPGT